MRKLLLTHQRVKGAVMNWRILPLSARTDRRDGEQVAGTSGRP